MENDVQILFIYHSVNLLKHDTLQMSAGNFTPDAMLVISLCEGTDPTSLLININSLPFPSSQLIVLSLLFPSRVNSMYRIPSYIRIVLISKKVLPSEPLHYLKIPRYKHMNQTLKYKDTLLDKLECML